MLSEAKSGLAAIVQADCKILILGSLPGDASLKQRQYYAHPRNALWPILSELLGVDLTALDFAQRYQTLLAHQIGLWDVIQSAQRRGSLDSALSQIKTNPLSQQLTQLPQLELVIFNGQAAAKHGTRYIPPYIKLAIAPSTSPAHTLYFSDKLTQWRRIFLDADV